MTSASAAAQPPDDDLELLLPFYAAGKLSPQEARRIEARLAGDAEFRRRLDLIEEERGQTVLLNDSIAPPSSATRERLFAMIDADIAATPAGRTAYQGNHDSVAAGGQEGLRGGLRAWLAGLAAAITPRAMGYAVAGLAALAIVQAGVLAHLASGRNRPDVYVTASAPVEPGGVHVLARFAPGVTMTAVAAWLRDNGMRIVDGPKPGDLWRPRIAADAAGKEAAMRKLRASPGVFATVLPE